MAEESVVLKCSVRKEEEAVHVKLLTYTRKIQIICSRIIRRASTSANTLTKKLLHSPFQFIIRHKPGIV